MFAKSFVLFTVCMTIIFAAPAPEANPEPEAKADPLVVSTYTSGLPVVGTYSTGLPLSYSASLPIARTYTATGLPIVRAYSGLPFAASYSPAIHGYPLTYSAVNGINSVAVNPIVVDNAATTVVV